MEMAGLEGRQSSSQSACSCRRAIKAGLWASLGKKHGVEEARIRGGQADEVEGQKNIPKVLRFSMDINSDVEG